jgi:hypothetical protein
MCDSRTRLASLNDFHRRSENHEQEEWTKPSSHRQQKQALQLQPKIDAEEIWRDERKTTGALWLAEKRKARAETIVGNRQENQILGGALHSCATKICAWQRMRNATVEIKIGKQNLMRENQDIREERANPAAHHAPDLGQEKQRTQEEISTKIKSFLYNKLNDSITQNHRDHHHPSLI